MGTPTITLIIPVYNGESCIEQCMDRLRALGPSVSKIVIVDDASTDGTRHLLANSPNVGTEIVVLVQESNQGQMACRLRGLGEASTEYVAFLDADDLIAPGIYDVLLEAAMTWDADVVGCNVLRVAEGGRSRPRAWHSTPEGCMTGADALRNFVALNLAGGTIWNRIYRSETLRSCDLEPVRHLRFNEDYLFNLAVLRVADRVGVVREYMYGAYENSQSVTRSVGSLELVDGLMTAWGVASTLLSQSDAERRQVEALYRGQLAIPAYWSGTPQLRQSSAADPRAMEFLDLAPSRVRARETQLRRLLQLAREWSAWRLDSDRWIPEPASANNNVG